MREGFIHSEENTAETAHDNHYDDRSYNNRKGNYKNDYQKVPRLECISLLFCGGVCENSALVLFISTLFRYFLLEWMARKQLCCFWSECMSINGCAGTLCVVFIEVELSNRKGIMVIIIILLLLLEFQI